MSIRERIEEMVQMMKVKDIKLFNLLTEIPAENPFNSASMTSIMRRNFMKKVKTLANKQFFVNVEDFNTKKAEFKEVEGRGKGLVLNAAVKQGELLFISKALYLSFHGNDQMINDTIAFHQQMKTPQFKQFSQLPFIDNTLISRHFNSAVPLSTQLNATMDSNGAELYDQEIDAIFIVNSQMNHACEPNVIQFCIGDLQFTIARQNLKAGDELFRRYRDPQILLLDQLRKELEVIYHFDCGCAVCRAIPDERWTELGELINRFSDELENNEVEILQEITAKIEKIYHEFQVRPRQRYLLQYCLENIARVCDEIENSDLAEQCSIRLLELYEVDGQAACEGRLVFKCDDYLIHGPILSNFIGLCWRSKDSEAMENVRKTMKLYFEKFFSDFASFDQFYPEDDEVEED